jgi:hypothetical protein
MNAVTLLNRQRWVTQLACIFSLSLSLSLHATAVCLSVLRRILATPGLRSKLDRLMAAKGGSFEREAAYRVSQAAGERRSCKT